MADNEVSTAPEGVEQQPAANEPAPLDDQQEGLLDGEGTEPQEVEIDYGGNKYKLPPGTPPEVVEKNREFAKSLWAEFTRNNQKAVETAKALEAKEAETRSVLEFRQAVIDDVAEFRNVDKQLSQYKDVNWDSARMAVEAIADPLQKQQAAIQLAQASSQFTQLLNRRNELNGVLSQKEQQYREYQRQKTEEALGQIGKMIPDWSDTKRNELRAFALEAGVSTNGFAQITDAALVQLVHEAKLYREMQKKAKEAATPKQTQPVTPVKSNASTAQRDPERMSPEEWRQWREQQIRARRNLKQYQKR